ncbi:MAG TPA: hypothetical protein VGU61_20000 [Noviherbaspirillum sp.]|jgi:hypothetical protein|uniref:hypothetical protein n=1 Tax=Noviherbaspirillum sp. TaxID=1926288 RepID=UPI002DDCBCC6|nr:hypothetical protein [Noviherbaspirillum sp.]HEV2612556.1 hypothetical protein [Noviherbaspirillum sp.]
MHALPVIKNVCSEAIEAREDDKEHWRNDFCAIVAPEVVLSLIADLEKPPRISEEELQALGKLVRDLTGFIKLRTGDASDPVRDDLLLQARQLLGLAGI